MIPVETRGLNSRLRQLRRDDTGSVLLMVAFLLTVLLALTALAVDVGHAYYSVRDLQATTDAAALGAARAVSTATSIHAINGSASALGNTLTQYTGSEGVATQLSSVNNANNARPGLPSVTVTTTLKCLTTLQAQGIPCIGTVPYNAVQVQQTSVIPNYFAGIFGKRTSTLGTTATAAINGGAPRAANVAVVIDTTLSMNEYDADCGNTQMQCALNGFQILLQHMTPCGIYQGTCAANGGSVQNPMQSASLFTFPDVSVGTASIDSNCTTPFPAPSSQNGYSYSSTYGTYSMPPAYPWGGVPTAMSYSFPQAGATSYQPSGSSAPTYQLTSFLYDYRASAAATTLNSSSVLVKASGAVTNCGGLSPSNYDGVYGTYHAGVIYAAQAALVAQHQAYPSNESILIFLSDGDAHAPQTNGSYTVMPSPATYNGYYPSWVGECAQAVVAAQAASAAGTLVYTVAYGASPIGCSTDAGAGQSPNITPCGTMAQMATAPQLFYSDWKQTGSGSTCVASQPVVSLADIFKSIANTLSQARLIPNNTT